SVGDRLLFFGGATAPLWPVLPPWSNEVWAFDLKSSSWSLLATGSGEARVAKTAFDPAQNRLWILTYWWPVPCGYTCPPPQATVHSLDLGTKQWSAPRYVPSTGLQPLSFQVTRSNYFGASILAASSARRAFLMGGRSCRGMTGMASGLIAL